MLLKLVCFLLFSTYNVVCAGRSPSDRDHVLCKIKMYLEVEEIQETVDPEARVEAYHNQTGFPCKTYCKLITKEGSNGKVDVFNAPLYEKCSGNRYCDVGGKCRRIETFEITKEEEDEEAEVGNRRAEPPKEQPKELPKEPQKVDENKKVTIREAAIKVEETRTDRHKNAKAPVKKRNKANHAKRDREEDY